MKIFGDWGKKGDKQNTLLTNIKPNLIKAIRNLIKYVRHKNKL